MCYMPWHLPWKLNLLNCCLESHTSINWRGSVDIWLSDISRGDGLLPHLWFEHKWLAEHSKIIIAISLTQAPIKKYLYYWNSSYQMYKSEPLQGERCHKLISNLLISHFLGSDWTFGTCVCLHRFHKSYLLLLSALQVPPLLCYVAEVHLVHGHLDVADGIMFGEAVKIVHRHDQRLSTELHVGDLRRMATVKGQKWLKTGILSH